MAARLSPGIFVNELDFSEFAPALGLARALVIGGATKGPLNTPVFVRDPSELTREFGNPVLTDYGLQSAVQFLKKGNQLLYLRVADGTEATADVAITGTTGGTAAVAATGTISLTGSTNPTDGETISIRDGSDAVAATGTITFTAAAQPTDGDTVEILDGTEAAATATITSAGATPTNGDTITLDDAEGDSKIYEFTDGGGLTTGDIEVDKSLTSDEGMTELAAAINGSGQNLSAGAVSGSGPYTFTLTHGRAGFGGNAATIASAGTAPPTGPANLSGGQGGRLFEFDPAGTSAGNGIVGVVIGAATTDTNDNLRQAINAAGAAGEVNVSGSDTTGGGDPQTTVTHGQSGTVGNAATMATTGATPPTVTSPLSGGDDGTAVVFEFDDDASFGAGNTGVLIGATAADTLTNLINAINTSSLDITAVDGTITIPQADLTHDTPGDAGNQTILETGANIAATGMSGGTDAVPGSSSTVMTLLASSPGTWGNDIVVEIVAPTVVFGAPTDNFDLNVTAPVDKNGVTQVVERFTNLSLDSTSARFIETVLADGIRGEVDKSQYLVADVLVSSGTPDDGQSQLGTGGGTSGADGIDAIDSTDIIGTLTAGVATGMQAIKNPDTVEFNILLIPGVTHNAVIQEAQSIAELRGDFIFNLDPPFGLTKQEVIDWHNGLSAIVPNAPTQPIDSTYININWAWLQDFDDFNQVNIWLPPSGFVAAQMAFNDQVAGPWFPVAGFNRGVIDADDAEYSPDLSERDDLNGGQNRINPVVNFADVDGLVLFGNRTTLRSASLLADVHVRRLLIHAEKLIASAVRVLVFEPNDPITWKKFQQLVNPILSEIAANRGLEKFEVVINSSLNPPAQRRQKLMRGRLNLTPIDSAEKIEIDFAVFSTGAEFTEAA